MREVVQNSRLSGGGKRSFAVKVRGKQTNSFAECHRLPAGRLSARVKGALGKTEVEMS